MALVDVHTHFYESEHLSGSWAHEWGVANAGYRAVQGIDASTQCPPADAETHARATAAADRVVVLAFRSRDGLNVPNDAVADYVRGSDRLIGFGAVDPASPDAVAEVERLPELGLRGLKLAPIYHYVAADDPRLEPILGTCESLDLPVLIHMGTTFLQFAPLEFAWPVPLERWLRRFPRLRLTIAHLGHPWEAETIVLIRKHPNAFADLSALAFRPHRFATALFTAIEYGVTHKLLFGSDFPVQSTADALATISRFVGVRSPAGTEIREEHLAPALDGRSAARFLDGPSLEPEGVPPN